MKFKKTVALVTSLLLAGSGVFTSYFNYSAGTNTIFASANSYSLAAHIDNTTVRVSPGGKLTIGTLISHGLQIYLFNSSLDYTDEVTDMSSLTFDFPEITESGPYEITVSHRKFACEPLKIGLYVIIDDSLSSDPVYSVELFSNSYKFVIESGERKLWNRTYRIECDSCPENFMIPVYSKEGEYSKIERENRIFELSENSINVSGSSGIYVPQGIYEIRKNAFTGTDSVKTVTVADSVRVIEEQDLGRDVVFRGNFGSCAEKFAYKNDYKFEYIGDINNDGNIDSSDILKLYSFMKGIGELDKNEAGRADKNMDAEINIADLVMLKNAVLDPGASGLGASTADAIAVPDLRNFERISEPENIDGYMNFAVNTASAVLLDTEDSKGPENTVYSPLSVYMALSMAAECSDGNTLDEFLKVLYASDIDDLRSENSSLFRSLYFDEYLAYMKIANSIWLNNSFKFKQEPLDNIAKHYYGVSFAKDFYDENTPEEIADWISLNTSGKFRPVCRIDRPDLELMRIINTVTFKERWKNKFGNAVPDVFYLKNGEEIQCDFMKRTTTYETENIGFADSFMKYALEMYDGYKMNFILPDEGVSIDSIVADKNLMEQIYSDDLEYHKRKLVFSVPKFDVASKYDLVETSIKLGLNDAFDPNKGDFSKVFDCMENDREGAYLSQIIHEAKVTIDEEGCEGSAYTLISMNTSTSVPPSYVPVIFELNRPFFYYISDKNNIPVFSGIINDPTEANQ